MKMILAVAVALAACVAAAPQALNEVKTLRYDNNPNPDGSYSFNLETEDGIQRMENGELRSVVDAENKPHVVVVVRGSYAYPDEQGQQQVITYYADESGYHAEGNAIPKAPARR